MLYSTCHHLVVLSCMTLEPHPTPFAACASALHCHGQDLSSDVAGMIGSAAYLYYIWVKERGLFLQLACAHSLTGVHDVINLREARLLQVRGVPTTTANCHKTTAVQPQAQTTYAMGTSAPVIRSTGASK